MILFAGDCHGDFVPLIEEAGPATAVVLLGDQEPMGDLAVELGPSLAEKTWWIYGILGHGEAMGDPSTDHEWHETVELRLGPHPGLLEGPRAVVEADYGMVNGEVVWKVKRAMALYVLTALHLREELERPEHQQVVLLNKNMFMPKPA